MSPTNRNQPFARGRPGSALTEIAALAELAIRAWQPMAELGLLLNDPVFWGWSVPRGDGHPVLTLPGLLGGDQYLQPLRGWLRRIGYQPVRSGIDRNPGWSEGLVQTLVELAERSSEGGRRPITIVGHSMGGILGRSVARRRPDAIRHVIALGAPLSLSRGVWPERVRLTAIYSQDDRIVPYPAAVARDAGARNVSVRGSHVGLAANPEVYRALAEALPHPVGATGRRATSGRA
jgi:pimeloyl-ACP methyl ester carboxylesterase